MRQKKSPAQIMKPTRIKRVFQLFLISYIITLLLPAAGMLYLYRQLVHTAEENCAQDAAAIVSDAAASLQTQLAWMDSTSVRFLLDSQMSSMLFEEPLAYGDQRVNTFNAFARHLNDVIGIYDVNFYGYRMLFQNSELIFYHEGISHGLSFYFENAMHYENMTYNEWYEAVFSANRKKILPVAEIKLGDSSLRAMTYNYPITRRSVQGDRKAVLQFFIPEQSLIPDHFDDFSSGYVIAKEDGILANFGLKSSFPLSLDEVTEEGWKKTSTGLIAFAPVNTDLTIALFVPNSVAFSDTIQMRKPILITFFIIAAIEGILTWYLAKRNAHPIESLAGNIATMLNIPRQGNEWDYVHRGIEQLQHDRTDSQQRSYNAETALLFSHIVNYRMDNTEEVMLEASRSGIDLHASSYCVAVVSLDTPGISSLQLPAPEAPLRLIICKGSNKRYHLLFLSEQIEDMELIVLQYLRQHETDFPSGVKIGIGRSYCMLTDASSSYHQALYCLQMETEEKIIQFEQVSPGANSLYFPLDQQQRILNAVKRGAPEMIQKEFEAVLYENTVKRHLSSLLKRTLLSTIEALLLTAAENVVKEENLSDYLHSLHQNNDFRIQLDVLRDEFLNMAQQSKAIYSDSEAQLRKEIQQYLTVHFCEPSLSISEIADAFGFSESYFSVLFKTLFGETYSNYLEEMRMEFSRVQLKTTAYSVEEISARSGYNNSTSFRRAFKRVEGITPQQYRDQAK